MTNSLSATLPPRFPTARLPQLPQAKASRHSVPGILHAESHRTDEHTDHLFGELASNGLLPSNPRRRASDTPSYTRERPRTAGQRPPSARGNASSTTQNTPQASRGRPSTSLGIAPEAPEQRSRGTGLKASEQARRKRPSSALGIVPAAPEQMSRGTEMQTSEPAHRKRPSSALGIETETLEAPTRSAAVAGTARTSTGRIPLPSYGGLHVPPPAPDEQSSQTDKSEVDDIMSKISAAQMNMSRADRPSSAPLEVQVPATPKPEGQFTRKNTRGRSLPPEESLALPSPAKADRIMGTPVMMAPSLRDEPTSPRRAPSPGPDIGEEKPRKRTKSPVPRQPRSRKSSKSGAHRNSNAEKVIDEDMFAMSFKGKWQAHLENPETDSEMKLETVIKVLSECGLLDERLAPGVLQSFLTDVACNGADIPGVVKIAGGYSGALKFAQFVGVLQWISQIKNLSYAECVSKFTGQSGDKFAGGRRHLREFWGNNCRTNGKMNAFDVLRAFEKTFLTKEERPNIGDVYIMFSKIRKKASNIDCDEFEKLVRLVGEKNDVSFGEILKKMFWDPNEDKAEEEAADKADEDNPLAATLPSRLRPLPQEGEMEEPGEKIIKSQLKRSTSHPQLESHAELKVDVHSPTLALKHLVKTPSSKAKTPHNLFRRMSSDDLEDNDGYQSD